MSLRRGLSLELKLPLATSALLLLLLAAAAYFVGLTVREGRSARTFLALVLATPRLFSWALEQRRALDVFTWPWIFAGLTTLGVDGSAIAVAGGEAMRPAVRQAVLDALGVTGAVGPGQIRPPWSDAAKTAARAPAAAAAGGAAAEDLSS